MEFSTQVIFKSCSYKYSDDDVKRLSGGVQTFVSFERLLKTPLYEAIGLKEYEVMVAMKITYDGIQVYLENKSKMSIIDDIIKPETDLERLIISDVDFIEGAKHGKPRNGHPEGAIIYHIGHVLENIDKYSTPENRKNLRLIAIIHDAFKYKVDRSKPKEGKNHHAVIARLFAEKYIVNNEVLEIIELHDEAYNSWCKGDKNGNWRLAESRAARLIKRLGKSISLYLAFYNCDRSTEGKSGDNYNWFVDRIFSE